MLNYGISGTPPPVSPTMPVDYSAEFKAWSDNLLNDISKMSSNLKLKKSTDPVNKSTSSTIESNFWSKNGNSILGGVNSGFDLAKGFVKQSDYKADQLFGTGLDLAGNVVSKFNPALGTAMKGLAFINNSFGPTVKGTKANDYVDRSSSYGGADAMDDKKFGIIGSIFGGANRYRNRVADRNQERYAASSILKSAEENFAAAGTGTVAETYNNLINGIYSPTKKATFGKSGLKLDLDFAHRVLHHLNKKGSVISEFKSGGKMNIIPDGALHARKHDIDNPDLNGNITAKGIPVIKREGGSVDQIAEIEVNEIIFSLDTTNKLEKLRDKGDDEAAIEAGKILVEEILYNTKDYTGLIDKVDA